jgi:hypothetical protein
MLCLAALLFCFSNYADAHVKWFADYDIRYPPRSPSEIVHGEYFSMFCLAVGPIMFATAYIDRYLMHRPSWLLRSTNTLTDKVQPHFPMTMRLGVSAFFIAAASYGGFILTPDLKTQESWMPAAHLAIAALVLLPRTAFLAGFAIIALYAHAVDEFGVYHLLDYPIFLGVAAYLIINSLFGEEHSLTALMVMRCCTGVTLLWAGIEKFAFPEWSFVLLDNQPGLTFGFSAEFYMVAAGFVEFCCAYLLIVGAFSARASALVLLFFFVSAVYYFGLIDAIGHSAIIIVLAILTLSQNPLAYRLQSEGPATFAAAHTALFFGTLLLFIGFYFVGHYISYRSFHPSLL